MKRIAIVFAALVSIVAPHAAHAVDPSIVSFSVSQSSIVSGQTVSFIWDLQNAGGYTFIPLCGNGIKLKRNDSAVDCGTQISSTQVTDDYAAFIVNNVTGSTASLTGRIIPKDASGEDVDSLARDIPVFVATLANPITSFTASTTTVPRASPVDISWITQELDGVNLMIGCNSNLRVTSPSYEGVMPCDAVIFSTDLGPSSSVTLNFTNSASSPTSVRLTLLPAVAPGQYDGSHALTLTLNIDSDTAPDPAILSFAASPSLLASGQTTKFTWATDKALGVNIKFSCNGIVASSTVDPAKLFPCDTLLFEDALSPNGELSVEFRNPEDSLRSVVVSLFPSKIAGQYDGTLARTVTLTVRPEVKPVASSTPSVPYVPSPPPPSSSSPGSVFVFTKVLVRGQRGADVSALQSFLARDLTLYPEALVTGYFGSLTERAVQRFQARYGIVSSGSPATTGYGMVGPRTRAKLNELY